MDIYNFIRSRDVAEYCRKIGKKWDTCEMAAIIDRSYRPLVEKHAAWQELIDEYPDMPYTLCMVDSVCLLDSAYKIDSIHERLRELIDEKPDSSKGRLLDEIFVDIPIPFKKGDILKCTDTENIFVLYNFAHDDIDWPEDAQKGEPQVDEHYLAAWGYFVNKNGMLYGDEIAYRDTLEFYHGKLEGNKRLLHYVSLFLNNKIGLTEMLAMQCRIVAEHQLDNVLSSMKGCGGSFYIPIEHLAENRMTPDDIGGYGGTAIHQQGRL